MIKTAIVAMALCLAVGGSAEAKTKAKKTWSRSDFTKEQQEKFYLDALKSCQKRYGTRVYRVKIDYTRRRSTCIYYF
jgi:hypothetical protein